MGSPDKKLNGLRLLREFLYEEIGKDENGNPIRNFHRIYDYQTILELKKWSVKGNFDRVSEMILRGIEWKGMALDAENRLEDRRKLVESDEEYQDNIMNRSWF